MTTSLLSPILQQQQQQHQPQQQEQQKYAPLHKATLELLYFKAVSLYRRRNYEKCTEVCNAILETGHENNVQMFATNPDDESGVATFVGGSGGGGGGVGGIGTGDDGVASSFGAAHSSNIGYGRYNSNNNNNKKSNIIGSSSAGSNLLPGMAARRHYNNNGSGNNSSYNNNSSSSKKPVMPTWMMEGIWQLKMRALTQRVYVDDLETNDDGGVENEEVQFERIATAARPGTSIKTAFIPRPSTSTLRQGTASSVSSSRIKSAATRGGELLAGGNNVATRPKSARPTSGMARPGTGLSRPGSSLGSRPASRCGTASRVRATSAAAYTVGDTTAPLYQAPRLNPTIYAERQMIVKSLFLFLFYHESDIQKAYSLCEAVMEVAKQRKRKQQQSTGATSRTPAPVVDWWWDQQIGRCLLALRYPRKAEAYLQQSLAAFAHPDTYLLLSRLYQRLEQPQRALDLINTAVERHPFDLTFRTEQGRLFEFMSKPEDAVQMYRLVVKLNPINIEALACIAVNYFYDNNPEMALMYYRRILALGVHTPELYCNLGLCCLYGGQIDLVMPCFQRCLNMAKTPEQRADIWYNLSFVAITTGDFNLARRCLQLCLTSDASNGAALNNLAVLSAHGNDLTKAKSYLNAAKEVLHDSFEIESNLAYMEKNYKL